MDAWLSPALANGAGVVGVIVVVGFMVLRGLLVPRKTHRELVQSAKDEAARAEQRADRWEAVALKALHATECLAEPVAVASKVLTKLPSPSGEGSES